MTNQENVLWFDNLDAPKHLKASDNTVYCSIGFNHPTVINGITTIKGEIIEVEADSITEALKDARLQFEFLTADVLSAI